MRADGRCFMDVDAEKLQQAVLALLHLNTFDKKAGKRAWKALPWSVMDQLHDKGYISDPATKAKSVWLSDEGAKLSEELFKKLFAIK
jgi:Domain of unknown function (DUF6429)